jgi:predicted RNA-binding Zn ribbon-like protein
MPKRIGGHAALDFCNTWAGWDDPEPKPGREWLPEYADLAVWTLHAGLLDRAAVRRHRRAASRATMDAEQIMDQARTLRAALYRFTLDPHDTRAFRRLAPFVRRAAAEAELIRRDDGRAAWVLPRSLGIELPLLVVAQAAGQFITSEARHHVGRCPGRDCGWLFIDRRGRRKWCDMATCGNRAKARGYLARRKRRS